MKADAEAPENLVLIGWVQKPFGLVGEIKVKPETFDFDRHKQLDFVLLRLQGTGEIKRAKVIATRADARFWYLRFQGYRTPEAAGVFSGAELLLASEDKLELPEGMVYFADMPGCLLVDENGQDVGVVADVIDQGIQQLLKIERPGGEVLIPWNDHFIKRIDIPAKRIEADLGPLRGIIL